MKNRDIIITVIVVVLIGWLVVRHFSQEKGADQLPPPVPPTTQSP